MTQRATRLIRRSDSARSSDRAGVSPGCLFDVVRRQFQLTRYAPDAHEDVLIQRVHGWIDEERVDRRMKSINAFEELLRYDNNTLILKFYLHISEEQQEEELLERIEEPEKYYKHSDGDWVERQSWDEYRDAYEDLIARSTIPWHVVPVDQRWYRNYIMSGIVVDAMENLDMEWPELVTKRDWDE